MKKRVKKLKKKLKKGLVLLQSLRDAVSDKPRADDKAGKVAWRELQAQHATADAVTEGMRGTLDETIRTLTSFRASLHRASPSN
ncbi:MAG: hypothetical protein ABJE95_30125 [Byssovorax sp.]